MTVPSKQEIIDALRWGADQWERTAIQPGYTHSCRLCQITDCGTCPLLIHTLTQQSSSKCANWGRYMEAYCTNDLETAAKEAAILAGVMRWEAFKLEHYD